MNIEQFGPAASWFWHAYQAPIVAALTAVCAFVAGRALGRTAIAHAGSVLAVAVGWLVLLWRPAADLVWRPRGWTERLLGVGVAATVFALSHPALRGRLARWSPWLLFAAAGWWLASPLAARQEFWRVWLAVSVFAAVLARLVGEDASRSHAAALALWGSMLLLGSPVWAAVAAMPAVAALVAIGTGRIAGAAPAAVLPFTVVVACSAAASSLGGGFAVRGGVGPLDVAALSPLLAVLLQPAVTRRFGRLGAVLSSAAAAGAVACAVWLAARAIR